MKITLPMLRVLRALLDAPEHKGYGYDLMQAAGLKSGTLYPLLGRLAEAGWVTRESEDVDPSEAGRPARRYYRLTADGEREGRFAIAEMTAALGVPAPIEGGVAKGGVHVRLT